MILSIITINYNNLEGLKRTVNSVVSQSFKDFEWIVIDGGSTDGSRELIEQYADRFAYWVSEQDKGIYNAMNKGIKVAKGEYLQFLNSGDWLCDETALDRCFSHHFSADIVYGNLYSAKEGKRIGDYFQSKDLTFRMLLSSTIMHSATFIRKEIIVKELYDESLHIVSDWKFFLRQALKNKTFEYIDEFVTFFDTTGISATNMDLNSFERKKVIREEVSSLILADYKRMGELEARLNDGRLKKVLEYSAKSVFYKKLITACLLLVEIIDNIFCHQAKQSGNKMNNK